MAIQLPNPGIGDGQTGDNEYVMWTKVKDNFNNQTHAASRLVGTADGQVPLSQDVASLSSMVKSRTILSSESIDINSAEIGSRIYSGLAVNAPPKTGGNTMLITTQAYSDLSNIMQVSFSPISGSTFTRFSSNSGGTWTTWKPSYINPTIYTVTTGTAPNVVVESDGTLKRASSSAKYKEVIAKLEIDDELYQKAMQVEPIVYRSKSDGDPKNWHYMSFLAEELGELDPALTQWKTHEPNPETGELDELEEKEAEGINLNAICAVLHATNIYQDKKLKELEQRLTALELGNGIEPVEETIVEEAEEEPVEEPEAPVEAPLK